MQNIVIMGLGNLLYGDEGFGVHAVALLARTWDFPAHVQLIDGGTQGHSLLTFVEEADKLLVLDTVDFGQAAGSLSVRKDAEIPAYLTAQKISPHQNSFSEVLALAELRGHLPTEIVLIGVHPVSLTMGAPLTPPVEKQLPAVLQLTLNQLQAWGVRVQSSVQPSSLYHPELAHLRKSFIMPKKISPLAKPR
ncbi:MAG: HyaD/HybD family hydrogenase maturation endopeptidase [Desulfovibrionaceae bacterium]